MASSLSESAVRHVAELARLKITDAEAAQYVAQLSKILGYVEQLDELDTTDVPPLPHPLAGVNVFREDGVRPAWSPQQALHNAPQAERDFFQVPKVLEQEGA